MSRSLPRRLLALLPFLVLAGTLACGPQFDPSSEVKSLRVLGVKKSKPYAQPGEDVSLQLLWDDPKGDGRAVQSGFIGGCVNPIGDLYYGCFPQFAEKLAKNELPFGAGDTFQVTLPQDILSSRPVPHEAGQTRYGLYIVFFVTCAGRLDFVTAESASATDLPLRCLDADDQPLGSDDFVVGYSSIYSFADTVNTNPEVGTTFKVAGSDVSADCTGEACQGAPAVAVDCSTEADRARCIKACSDDGDSSCPAIEVAPQISPTTVETDDVSSKLFGAHVTEQMWVNYYVDRGGISEVRLLNDSSTGWNEKYRAQLRAPKDAGSFQLWAVVHDNRGGMEFSRVTLGVE
jgi:hypothetical protein